MPKSLEWVLEVEVKGKVSFDRLICGGENWNAKQGSAKTSQPRQGLIIESRRFLSWKSNKQWDLLPHPHFLKLRQRSHNCK